MPRLTAIRKQAIDEMMKQALFEAAIAVIKEYGVSGLTMDRIAAAAGVAKGSLYRYFRGKRDLLEFLYAKMLGPIFQATDEVLKSDRSALEKIDEHLRYVLKHVAETADIHGLLFDNEAVRGLLQPSERRTFSAACEQLAVLFRQGIDDGVFHPADPLLLAHMYLGLLKGTLESRPELTWQKQRDELRRMIQKTFLEGIGV